MRRKVVLVCGVLSLLVVAATMVALWKPFREKLVYWRERSRFEALVKNAPSPENDSDEAVGYRVEIAHQFRVAAGELGTCAALRLAVELARLSDRKIEGLLWIDAIEVLDDAASIPCCSELVEAAKQWSNDELFFTYFDSSMRPEAMRKCSSLVEVLLEIGERTTNEEILMICVHWLSFADPRIAKSGLETLQQKCVKEGLFDTWDGWALEEAFERIGLPAKVSFR